MIRQQFQYKMKKSKIIKKSKCIEVIRFPENMEK